MTANIYFTIRASPIIALLLALNDWNGLRGCRAWSLGQKLHSTKRFLGRVMDQQRQRIGRSRHHVFVFVPSPQTPTLPSSLPSSSSHAPMSTVTEASTMTRVDGSTQQYRSNRRITYLPYHNDTSIHEYFMTQAMEQARLAGRMDEVPIGAIVVKELNEDEHPHIHGGDDAKVFRILSTASNRMETYHDASAHAELLAMRGAARRLRNWRLLNTTLYTSLEPCPMCLSACHAFRISRIVYGAPDLRLGAIESYIRLLDITKHPTHAIDDVVPHIQKEQSAALMRGFFRERRELSKRRKQRMLAKQETKTNAARR